MNGLEVGPEMTPSFAAIMQALNALGVAAHAEMDAHRYDVSKEICDIMLTLFKISLRTNTE